jgi:hypothetical protein
MVSGGLYSITKNKKMSGTWLDHVFFFPFELPGDSSSRLLEPLLPLSFRENRIVLNTFKEHVSP